MKINQIQITQHPSLLASLMMTESQILSRSSNCFGWSICMIPASSWFVSHSCPFSQGWRILVQILQDQTLDPSGFPFSFERHKCHPETHHRWCCPPNTDLHSIRYLCRGLGHEAVWYLAMIYKAGVRTEFETTCLNAWMLVLKVSLSNFIYRRITNAGTWPFGLD